MGFIVWNALSRPTHIFLGGYLITWFIILWAGCNVKTHKHHVNVTLYVELQYDNYFY